MNSFLGLNRTIIGLKFFGKSVLLAGALSGLNRTIIGLKLVRGRPSTTGRTV